MADTMHSARLKMPPAAETPAPPSSVPSVPSVHLSHSSHSSQDARPRQLENPTTSNQIQPAIQPNPSGDPSKSNHRSKQIQANPSKSKQIQPFIFLTGPVTRMKGFAAGE